MASLSRFIVIVERSARQALLSAALLATALSVSAQTNSTKIARDLQPVLTAATTPAINWARDVNGRRYVKVLIVSMYPEDQYAIRALRAGAHGYVNKGGDPQLLVQAVRTVAQGRKYVTPEIAQMLVENLNAPAAAQPHEKLSDRELQTLVMIASGKRLSDIATDLVLSPKTVSVYRARVLEKLQLANNSELTVYAIRNGLVGS